MCVCVCVCLCCIQNLRVIASSWCKTSKARQSANPVDNNCSTSSQTHTHTHTHTCTHMPTHSLTLTHFTQTHLHWQHFHHHHRRLCSWRLTGGRHHSERGLSAPAAKFFRGPHLHQGYFRSRGTPTRSLWRLMRATLSTRLVSVDGYLPTDSLTRS